MTPVCLPSSQSPAPAVNSVASVTGFGTTDENSEDPSSRLLTVDINIISNNDCKTKNNIYSSKVVDSMICGGSAQGGKDACKRDSGGPLVQETGAGGGRRLIGVVSWGQGCGQARYPGVYTRVSSFTAWIDQNIVSGRMCSA